MLALAIDIGVVAVARGQAQNAADAGAMAGARTVNGDETINYNIDPVPSNAVRAAIANRILGQQVDADPDALSPVNDYTWKSRDVQIEVGAYAYLYNDADPSKEKFDIQFPRTDDTEPYSAVRVTVKKEGDLNFAKIFGMSTFNTQATAVAAHRPRDVMIIVDLSGSMRFQSLPGVAMNGTLAEGNSTTRMRTRSMNPDPDFPRFGHYSDTTGAALQGTVAIETSTGEYVDPANISVSSTSGPPIVNNFYSNPVGSAPSVANRAWTAAPSTYTTTPGGDNYLKLNRDTHASTYAKTVTQFNNNSSTTYPAFELNGYRAVRATFNGYTQGPSYWGKTFWVWPPSPGGRSVADGGTVVAPPTGSASTALATTSYDWHDNGSKDWRQRFFVGVRTQSSTTSVAWIQHNTILWNSSGSTVMKKPGDTTTVTENGTSVSYTFRINYAAILYWISQQSIFPSTLQGGRIRYYTAIPSGTDRTLNNRWWTTNPTSLSDDERFWKEYIDFVLGYVGTGAGTYSSVNGSSIPYSAFIGNGNYFTWSGSTWSVSARPQPQPAATNPNGPYQSGRMNAAASSGATTVAVKELTVANPGTSHFIVVNNDYNNPYRVTASATTGTSGLYNLTITPGLASAAALNANVKVFSPYMNYGDDVPRPRHQYWFGAQTMVDWLGNYSLLTLANNQPHHWWPGNAHEAQGWACKVGVQSAIKDIKTNHPNDFVGLAFFSAPQSSRTGSGHHNRAVVPLGRSYQQLIDSLWFPPTTVTGGVSEIGPYDEDMNQVPRADGGTAPGMGFMIAYNQFSSNVNQLRLYSTPTATYRGTAGGMGRKGAERVIIFETDGSPNTRAYKAITSSGGSYYYPIRVKNPANIASASNVEWPSTSGYNVEEVYDVVENIVAKDTASTPGFGTTRKKVKVYSIGYGSLFDPANAGPTQTTAVSFLTTVQTKGNVTDPIYKIYGTSDQRITKMQEAFSAIMQNGVQVSLIE